MTTRLLSIVVATLALFAGTSFSRAAPGMIVLATDAPLNDAFGMQKDRAGNLYVVEYTHRLVRIDPAGKMTVVAGNGEKGFAGDGGPAADARLNLPHCIAIGPDDVVYVADTQNHRVRRIDPKTGVITTFAGSDKGFAGDGGPAKDAKFNGPHSIALDPKGETMVIADLDNRRVRAIDMRSGLIRTVAGNGQKGLPDDGAVAATSPLVDPRAAAMDAAGNVYVLERNGNALRVVDASGKIRTVVGTGKPGATGDGGPGRDASLRGPKHLWVEASGEVLIADSDNNAVRRYRPNDGKIERVAGTGKKGDTGVGGTPENAELNKPHGVYVDPAGTLFIADSENHRVLKVVQFDKAE